MQAVSLNMPTDETVSGLPEQISTPNLDSLGLANPARMDFAADLMSSTMANNPNVLVNIVAHSFEEMEDSSHRIHELVSSGNVLNSPTKLLKLQHAIDDLSISSNLASKIVGVVVKDIDTLVRIQ